jgi:ClpP class serine protease
MEKEIISATIDKKTANDVRELASKEQRSFSKMIDLLLQNALSVLKGGEKKK